LYAGLDGSAFWYPRSRGGGGTEVVSRVFRTGGGGGAIVAPGAGKPKLSGEASAEEINS